MRRAMFVLVVLSVLTVSTVALSPVHAQQPVPAQQQYEPQAETDANLRAPERRLHGGPRFPVASAARSWYSAAAGVRFTSTQRGDRPR